MYGDDSLMRFLGLALLRLPLAVEALAQTPQVVINEVLYLTDPANSDPDRTYDWVELYNAGMAGVDVLLYCPHRLRPTCRVQPGAGSQFQQRRPLMLTATRTPAIPRELPDPSLAKRPVRSDWLRIALVPVFVLACYQFAWLAWRSFNCTAFLAISHTLGISAWRLSTVAFASQGRGYHFDIACTAVDAFLGSVPLLWNWHKPIRANLAFFTLYFAVLNIANMARLSLGMLIFVWGVPWWLSHEAMSGVCYFLMFLWIARRRGWDRRFPC